MAQEDRIRELLATGRSLLEGERHDEASEVFGRILLLDPNCLEARRGLERARAGSAEDLRRREAERAEAHSAPPASLGPADAAAPSQLAAAFPLEAEPSATPPAWPRRLLVAGWAVGFALMAAGVASSWEQIVGTLVRAPAPSSAQLQDAASTLPAPSPGERALAEARRLIERGDLGGVLEALDSIAPEDPAYPFARQLRREAEERLRDRGLGE